MPRPPISLLPALARVLTSVDAVRNLRALYLLMATFCMAGLWVASARSAVLHEQALASAMWIGLGLMTAFLGLNATGLLLMDQARGLPVRDPQDALIDALRCSPRVLLVLGASLSIAALIAAALVALLWGSRWPWIGPPLLGLVLPVGVLLLGAALFALVAVVAPLAGPAVWAGQSSAGTLRFLQGRLRHGLPETALLVATVYLLAALLTAAVSFIVLSGSRLLAGLAILGAGIELPAQQLMAGVMGWGPRTLGATGAPLQGGNLGLAALIGGGAVFALALVLPTLIYLRGCCAVYLALTADE